MKNPPSSVILIGMPGAGKSTIGVLIAKVLGLGFTDSDLSIQTREGRTLQQIVDRDGHLRLRHIEEEVLLDLDCDGQVVSTGGSAVYSEAAMLHLRRCGVVVYLDVPIAELHRRIHDFDSRGIAMRHDQSFEELFEERTVLYRKHSDITIDCRDMTPQHVVEALIEALAAWEEA